MKKLLITLLTISIIPIAYMAQTSISNVQGTIQANQAFTPAAINAPGTLGVVPAEPTNNTNAYRVLTNQATPWQSAAQVKAQMAPILTSASGGNIGYFQPNTNVSTGTTAPVVLNGTPTFTTTGGKVLLFWQGSFASSAAGSSANMQLLVDGTVVDQPQIVPVNTNPVSRSNMIWLPSLSSGSHTISINALGGGANSVFTTNDKFAFSFFEIQ